MTKCRQRPLRRMAPFTGTAVCIGRTRGCWESLQHRPAFPDSPSVADPAVAAGPGVAGRPEGGKGRGSGCVCVWPAFPPALGTQASGTKILSIFPRIQKCTYFAFWMTPASICLKSVLQFGAPLGISISLRPATNYHRDRAPFSMRASHMVLKRSRSLGSGKTVPVPLKPLKPVSVSHLGGKPRPACPLSPPE